MQKDDIVTLTGEKDACPSDKFSRRKFFGTAAVAAAGAVVVPRLIGQEKAQDEKPPAAPPGDIKTNVEEVKGIPRVDTSLPGKYPGKVVRVATGPGRSPCRRDWPRSRPGRPCRGISPAGRCPPWESP